MVSISSASHSPSLRLQRQVSPAGGDSKDQGPHKQLQGTVTRGLPKRQHGRSHTTIKMNNWGHSGDPPPHRAWASNRIVTLLCLPGSKSCSPLGTVLGRVQHTPPQC